MKTFTACIAIACLGAFPLAAAGHVLAAQLTIILVGAFSAALSN